MLLPQQRALQILGQLHQEFADILGNAVQIALHQSISAAAKVKELESMGFQVTTDFNYVITAMPVEKLFDQSLTEEDRHFLREPFLPEPDPHLPNDKRG
jgi:hypothetical protein